MKRLCQMAALASALSVVSVSWGQTLQWEAEGFSAISIAAGAGVNGGECAAPGDTCYSWVVSPRHVGFTGNQLAVFNNNHPAAGDVAWQTLTSAGVFITNDKTGLPWVIDALHRIYFWNGSGFILWDRSGQAFRIAVGNPNKPFEIWMIDGQGAVWANTGTMSSLGTWQNIPGETADSIAFANRTQECFPAGQGAGTAVHPPFIVNSQGRIFLSLLAEEGGACLDNTWTDTGVPGFTSAEALAADLVVGTDHQLYGFNWTTFSWQFVAAGTPAGLIHIANGPSGIWGIDANLGVHFLEQCGAGGGRGPTCVPFRWN
jgi:hypothetical protein